MTEGLRKTEGAGDDTLLEKQLQEQKRPDLPHDLREAREMVEGYIARDLSRHMTPPEAKIEAMRILARFERLAREQGRIDAMKEFSEGE